MLNSLDSRPFRSNHETYHSVGHSYLDCYVTRDWSWWSWWRTEKSPERWLTGCPDLGKVLGCWKYLAFCPGHVLFAPGYHEYWLLPTDWSFYVRVCLCTESFDLAACNQNEKKEELVFEHFFQELKIELLGCNLVCVSRYLKGLCLVRILKKSIRFVMYIHSKVYTRNFKSIRPILTVLPILTKTQIIAMCKVNNCKAQEETREGRMARRNGGFIVWPWNGRLSV